MDLKKLKDIKIKPINLNEFYNSVNTPYMKDMVPEVPKIDYENTIGGKMDKYIKLLEKQNEQLIEQNEQLKIQYDFMLEESSNNKEEAEKSRKFGWTSFIVGTFIGIIGILVAIFM